MANRQSDHPWDSIASEVADWLNTEPEHLAEALLYRGRAPFSAPTDEREKLDYYRRALVNPDGSPNEEARAALLRRAGVEGYANVLTALAREQQAGMVGGEGEGAA
jgi:hypothetical protein